MSHPPGEQVKRKGSDSLKRNTREPPDKAKRTAAAAPRQTHEHIVAITEDVSVSSTVVGGNDDNGV